MIKKSIYGFKRKNSQCSDHPAVLFEILPFKPNKDLFFKEVQFAHLLCDNRTRYAATQAPREFLFDAGCLIILSIILLNTLRPLDLPRQIATAGWMKAQSWRFYLAAVLVGTLAGLAGAAFHALIDLAIASRPALQHWFTAWSVVPGWLPLMVFCAMALTGALWIVRRFAPETAGSGIQEVEIILTDGRQLRWRRVLPVKFFAGLLAIGSGLVLGREGPTVHMGAAFGQMITDGFNRNRSHGKALISAGAAAGLAAAFNAPLAAIIFVTEELREQFEYRFATIQAVILASAVAVIVSGSILGQGPALPISIPDLSPVPVRELPWFLLLGVLIGGIGVLFNQLLLRSVHAVRTLASWQHYLFVGLLGLALGALLWHLPIATGGGESLVESLLQQHPSLWLLLILLGLRLLTTVTSYSIGLPGGIFAPMLALGTLLGAAFAGLMTHLIPDLALQPSLFAIAAMGALFAATVRAPLTGIILVIELTGALPLALPIILTCLTATFTAEALGGRPIYSQLVDLKEQPPMRKPLHWLVLLCILTCAFIAMHP